MSDTKGVGNTFYRIQKNVPIPQNKIASKYPFKDMEIGDSFFASGIPATYISLHSRMLRPMKFSCRTVTENGVRGLRVWRIE